MPYSAQKVKLCIECRYHSTEGILWKKVHVCKHPNNVTVDNLVDGEPMGYVFPSCFDVRNENTACGVSGKWFKEKIYVDYY